MNCWICGETKDTHQFKKVKYFTLYKRGVTQWCRDCQKMYMRMKKEKALEDVLKQRPLNYLVSFQ